MSHESPKLPIDERIWNKCEINVFDTKDKRWRFITLICSNYHTIGLKNLTIKHVCKVGVKDISTLKVLTKNVVK